MNQKVFPRNIHYRTRPNDPSFQSFFWYCETFSGNIFPLQFFGVSRQNGCLKIPKGPPLIFFGIVSLFSKHFFRCCRREYFDNLKSFLLFLSLRYGADLCRSRLVSCGCSKSQHSQNVLFWKKNFHTFLFKQV